MTYDLVRFVHSAAEIEARLAESGGELTDSLEEWIGFMDVALPGAVDHAKLLMDRLTTVEKEWRARADEVTRVARGIANAQAKIKERIKAAMIQTGTKELLGESYRLTLVSGKQTLAVDEAELSNDYKMPVTEIVPDKERIRAALEQGEEIAGAALVDSFQLRSYHNKK